MISFSDASVFVLLSSSSMVIVTFANTFHLLMWNNNMEKMTTWPQVSTFYSVFVWSIYK